MILTQYCSVFPERQLYIVLNKLKYIEEPKTNIFLLKGKTWQIMKFKRISMFSSNFYKLRIFFKQIPWGVSVRFQFNF
jgi:hypothetical protein